MDKKQVRAEIQKRIRALGAELRAEKSRKVAASFLALPEVKQARLVMAFVPMPDELDTVPIIESLLASGKRVAVPKVIPKDRTMLISEIRNLTTDLEPGYWGILEPRNPSPVKLEQIDVVCTPGRAFDREGNRLGRGGAYYDLFFSRPELRAVRVAVAFAEQVLDAVPHDQDDRRVHILVTDEFVLRFEL